MKLTKTKLKRIIKEELNKVLNEECHPMDQDCHNQENYAWQQQRQAAEPELDMDVDEAKAELQKIEAKCYQNGKWQCGGALKVRKNALHKFLKTKDPTQ